LNTYKNKGFTLVELVVVMSIISLLSSIVLVNLNGYFAKARDARRLSDMQTIRTALIMYYAKYGRYPDPTGNDCGGWDTGYNGGIGSGDKFIQQLADAGVISTVPGDPTSTSACGGYRYYRYGGGYYTTCCNNGTFFVLGITGMETGAHPNPSSPGWSCPGFRDWQGEFDWVTGGCE
jgi:prepilin-type N-terminal cleavage/methylation domain-containing protein